MPVQLSDATVLANNEVIMTEPNSIKFTEGGGEQKMRAASIGGGKSEQIYSKDIEGRFSKVMFDIASTPENIALVRSWKFNDNQNVFQIAGSTPEGTMTRTFTQAAVLNDYEVEIGSETNISVEISANPAI